MLRNNQPSITSITQDIFGPIYNLSALLGQLLLIAFNNEVHLHQPLNNTNTQQNTTYLFAVQD